MMITIIPAYKATIIETYFSITRVTSYFSRIVICAIVSFIIVPKPTLAQQLSAQEIRLLCGGLGSTAATDDGAELTLGDNGLRATTDEGELSVYQGDELLIEVEDFSFVSYRECLSELLAGSNTNTKNSLVNPLCEFNNEYMEEIGERVITQVVNDRTEKRTVRRCDEKNVMYEVEEVRYIGMDDWIIIGETMRPVPVER